MRTGRLSIGWWGAVLAMGAVLVAGGCSSHDDDPPTDAGTGVSVTPPGYVGGNLTYAQMDAEYRDEVTKLVLPAWVGWPAHARDLTPDTDPRPMVYSNGHGRLDAQEFWFCAWSRQFVISVNTDDSAGAKVAADNIQKMKDMPLRKYFTGPGADTFMDRAIDGAKLGDPGPASEYVQGAFCHWFRDQLKAQQSASPSPSAS